MKTREQLSTSAQTIITPNNDLIGVKKLEKEKDLAPKRKQNYLNQQVGVC
jgi:hypothetical protein